MSQQNPGVGRDVHYVSHGSPVRGDGTQAYSSVCRAAKITFAWDNDPDEGVSLTVFNPDGLFLKGRVEHDEDKSPGTWHWAEQA